MLTHVRRALALPVLAAIVALVGCEAGAMVQVKVEPDGSGVVSISATFDEEAVQQIGGDLSTALHLGDLREAGWTGPPPDTAGGRATVTLSKRFAAASELGPLMRELGGADLFADWKLTTSNSFTVSSYELTGSVRLTGSLDQFSDSEVAAALDGFATGRSADELAAALKANPDAFGLGVSVDLPGDLDEVRGLAEQSDSLAGPPSAAFSLGDGKAVDEAIAVRSSSTDRSAVLWVLLGGGLIVAAVLLFVAGKQQARRRARRRPPPAP